MIAVDTSALMAIVLDEPEAEACMAVLEAEDRMLMSAGTMAEALIVSAGRNLHAEMSELIEGIGCEVVAVTKASAQHAAEAYGQWGKGVSPAGLNYGDCFAYALAKEQGCRLLYVGGDFSKTDIEGAL